MVPGQRKGCRDLCSREKNGKTTFKFNDITESTCLALGKWDCLPLLLALVSEHRGRHHAVDTEGKKCHELNERRSQRSRMGD